MIIMYMPNMACRLRAEMVISCAYFIDRKPFLLSFGLIKNRLLLNYLVTFTVSIQMLAFRILVYYDFCIPYLPVLSMDPDWGIYFGSTLFC